MKTIFIITLFFYSGLLNLFQTLSADFNSIPVNCLNEKSIKFILQDSLMNLKKQAIVDCNYSLEEALIGSAAPADIKNNLSLVNVYYYSFDEKIHKGQIVIHRLLAKDILEIFDLILINKFPIAKVIPIVNYNWSDDLSMNDNNTSSFNYRLVAGTKKISNHAYGLAIDINPKLNPYIQGSRISPEGAKYDSKILGTIAADSFLVNAFKKRGWTWGGDWITRKDYQHFEKIIAYFPGIL
jgi:hypothetical protein